MLGHELLGRVKESRGGFEAGQLVAGIVRRPDPVPCACCARGEWDMCRNGQYTERGIKGLNGYGSELVTIEADFAIPVPDDLGTLGVLTEPTSILAKAWEQIERIATRACSEHRIALVTGAGPIGLLAALLGRQRELEVHVLDRATEGIKPEVVAALGAEYHTGEITEIAEGLNPDIVVECTGVAELVAGAMQHTAPGAIVCLAGVAASRNLSVDIGALNNELVLENDVVFGSVNANRRHFDQAVKALCNADQDWLRRLITRTVPLDDWTRGAREERRRHQERGRVLPALAGNRRYSRPSMPTSLVTGGAGFLGSHLCDYLLSRDQRVICVDNLETGSLENIRHLKNGANFRFEMLDITEHYEIDEPVDFVYHMASPASPIDYARLPLHTLKVGAYGTHNTLGLAKKHRARFLLASTSEVYGDPLVHPQPETYWGNVNPIGPRGVYDEAKRYAEALTMAYLRQQGVDTTIVRIFNTFGPRMRPNDGRAIPAFLSQALADRPVTVFGDGKQTRSFCYVDDLDPRARAARRVRGPRASEHRQSERDVAARDGEADHRADRVALRGRIRGAAGRRPPGPPAGHRAGTRPARLGAGGGRARGHPAHDRALLEDHRPAGVAMSSAAAKNLEVISKAIDEHNTSCEWPAVAVEMNPFEVERLGWDEIRGLPIRPNPEFGTGSFRIVCAREEGQLGEEETVEAVSDQTVPAELTPLR